ncbi:nucleotidyltransferase substrate binding protein, HI0074 family [uncultured Candidatus Thioglobus sp.]|nr:nucleotidyltransferase substrate binding protein, HI0074 family [uncultured Candidatus Thioglobus sp.]
MNTVKHQNFRQSIVNLDEVLLENKTAIVRDSAIKRYEICYELSWKSIQELLKNEGLEICNSPKNCFKDAFKLGLIENEEAFADMAQNRNLTTHTYNEDLANKIYAQLGGYLQILTGLAKNIGKKYDI